MILLISSIAVSAQAERTTPASEVELVQIAERGRNLFEYDVAVWHGSDAVMHCGQTKGAWFVTLPNGLVMVGP
jgi:hypothetical protein